jgi:hypothetical protein
MARLLTKDCQQACHFQQQCGANVTEAAVPQEIELLHACVSDGSQQSRSLLHHVRRRVCLVR